MIARCLALLIAMVMSTGSIYGITYAAEHLYRNSLQVTCLQDGAHSMK